LEEIAHDLALGGRLASRAAAPAAYRLLLALEAAEPPAAVAPARSRPALAHAA
jgi:hypothetical protein